MQENIADDEKKGGKNHALLHNIFGQKVLIKIFYFPQDHNSDLETEVRNKNELFDQFSREQLLMMVRCVHEAHDLAKRFNSDNEQRTVLWKAGELC